MNLLILLCGLVLGIFCPVVQTYFFFYVYRFIHLCSFQHLYDIAAFHSEAILPSGDMKTV